MSLRKTERLRKREVSSMSLFRLDASILPASSASRSLADLVEAEWTASHPDSTVTRRDLAADPVPATAWANAVTGGFVDEAQRTPAQVEARALATTCAWSSVRSPWSA